jgi:hypothetical protein
MIMAGSVGDLQGSSQADSAKAAQDSKAQLEENAENKKQADALKGFQQVLQQLP